MKDSSSCREADAKEGPSAGPVLGEDLSTMQAHDGLDDGEAEARAGGAVGVGA